MKDFFRNHSKRIFKILLYFGILYCVFYAERLLGDLNRDLTKLFFTELNSVAPESEKDIQAANQYLEMMDKIGTVKQLLLYVLVLLMVMTGFDDFKNEKNKKNNDAAIVE